MSSPEQPQASHEPEADIVNDILSRKTVSEQDLRYPESQIFLLRYGGKSLTVTFKPGGEVGTYVENVFGKRDRKPNETTLLYMAARKLMQERANAMNKTVTYEMRTYSERMREWAKHRGQSIFSWKSEGEGPKILDMTQFIFGTTIAPEEKS